MRNVSALLLASAGMLTAGLSGADGLPPPTLDTVLAAIRANDSAALKRALDAKPELASQRDANGVSALSLAAYMERQSLVEIVRGQRATPDFFEACIVGNERVVRNYLARGQDVNAYAPDGFTPLGLAVFFRNVAIARLLVDAGADVNARARNLHQVGAIHAAVARADLDTLELLLARGANPDQPQAKLVRPIHDAAASGKTAVVALLLMFGADPAARTEEGQTAADLARAKGYTALADRLSK
jgi:ankyrin repeat protein